EVGGSRIAGGRPGRAGAARPGLHRACGGAHAPFRSDAAGGRRPVRGGVEGDVGVVVVAGVARAEDLGEAVDPGLAGQGAQAGRADQVGRVAVEVTAVGRAADRAVAGVGAEAAGDGDRHV